MKLYLYDDATARGYAFRPFALTRPIGELLFGTMTLRGRAERALGLLCGGSWAGADLVGFSEPGAPAAVAWSDLEAPCVLLNSRVVLAGDEGLPEGFVGRLLVGGDVAGYVLDRDADLEAADELRLDPLGDDAATLELPGTWVQSIWNLMSANTTRVAADLDGLPSRGTLPPGVHQVGGGVLLLGENVRMEPGVLFDTSSGPIQVEDDVTLQAPLRLEGPAFVGRGSVLFGGSIGTSSIGPVCKVRGEIEASVVLGYSNKAHDGFLGHAVLGRWVNLGAMTTNSDLKNNYGPIRLRLPEGQIDTGLTKVGCFLGDHVKTGIGTVLNTGTVVGAGSNLFGGRMPPTYVPPFSWGAGDELVDFRIDKCLEVAKVVMSRRKVELDEAMATVLSRAWEDSAQLRAST